jgi:hypothetical protein
MINSTEEENERLRKQVRELTPKSDQMDELRSAIDELRARFIGKTIRDD